MSEPNQNNYDQIDLIDLLQTLWEDKLRIIGISIIFLSGAIIYNFFFTNTIYKARTEINLIKSSDAEKYADLNMIESFKVTPEKLLELYIEQLEAENRVLFKNAIIEYNLLDPKEFDDEESYDKAVSSLAYSIEINPYHLDSNNKKINGAIPSWAIKSDIADKDAWLLLLNEVDNQAIESTRQNLIKNFNSSMNSVSLELKFKLEDVLTKIENTRNDYQLNIESRLEFLKEQNEIAKALQIATSTIETQVFQTSNSVITNLMTETPYYLRGFVPISKEIELINSRKNTDAFIPNLIDLQNEMRMLTQNKLLKRTKEIFALTPAFDKNNFKASIILLEATKFQYNSQDKRLIIFSLIAGIISGSVFVIISNAIRNRKKK